MKTKLLRIFVLLLITVAGANSSRADHIVGSDISYKCIKDSVFKVVYNFYRDCNGCYVLGQSPKCGTSENCNSSLTAPTSLQVLGTAGSCSGKSFTNLTLTRTGIVDITKTCSKDKSRCQQPCNGSYPYGIEKHTFEGTLDLRAAMKSGCCNFRIAILLYVRSVIITTGQAGNSFFTSCDIDACAAPCNNSPVLSNDPIGVACCNQPYTFNNGALDTTDYDSLSFSLAPAFSANGTQAAYKSPLNYLDPVPVYKNPSNPSLVNPNSNPPTGFFLSPVTGDMVFTPAGDCPWVGIIVVEIKEWRKDKNGKWQVIGVTRRDMQVIATNCGPNNPPEITGTTTLSVCEGDKICSTIKGTDKQFVPNQTKPDTVTMTWNRGIPGATFTIKDPKAREKEAEFCWQTKIGDAKDLLYSFTVTAQDDNCPTRGVSVKAFRVKVKKKAQAQRKYTKKACGWLVFESNPENGFQGTPSYKWEIRDSTNAGKVHKLSFFKKDSFQFQYGGKYIITHIINNSGNCPTLYLDTIVIPPVLDVQLAFGQDTFVCWGSSITLNPTIKNGPSPYKYYWARPHNHISGDTLTNFSITLKQDTTIALRITDKNGCQDIDTIKIRVQILPVVNIGPDVRQCTYDKLVLDAGHNDTMRYQWLPNWDTTRQITVFKAGKYIARVYDSLNCFAADTMELFVNDTVRSMPGPDITSCDKDTVKLNAFGKPLNYPHTWEWTDLKTIVKVSTDSSYSRVYRADNCFQLHLTVTQGGVSCDNKDTICIKVNKLPAFTYNAIQPKCFDYGIINLHVETGMTPAGTNFWSNSTVSGLVNCFPGPPLKCYFNTPLLNNQATTERVYFGYKDPTTGCYNKDSMDVTINSNPVVQLRNRVYCQDLGTAYLDSSMVLPKIKTGFFITWRCISAPGGVDKTTVVKNKGNMFVPIWTFDLGLPTDVGRKGKYQVEITVADQITGCRTVDTSEILVVEEPTVTFDPIPSQCINWDSLDLHNFVYVNGLPNSGILEGTWSAVSYRGDRDATELPKAVSKGRYFKPGTGPGLWELKFFDDATGCATSDSMYVTVNNLPLVDAMGPVDTCSNAGQFALYANPNGGTWTGNGNIVNLGGSNYAFNPAPGASRKTTFRNYYAYTDPTTKCENKDSVDIVVQRMPTVDISTTPDPYEQCEDKTFNLAAVATDYNVIRWTSTGTGSFTPSNALNTVYSQSQTDKDNGSAKLYFTVDAWEKCPAVLDSIMLGFQHYPTVDFLDSKQGCAPLIADFTSQVSRVPLNQVTYDWDFGNGTTGTLDNPTGISYPNAGSYSVRLTVNNTVGNCSTTLTKPAYINVFPVPVADFTSDPNFYTTVALPRFRFINKSSVSNGSLFYLWNFGTGNPNDTSTKQNPVFNYSKDTGEYAVKLKVITDKGCEDSVFRNVKIGPDITVFIPNAFSPDGSGQDINNRFYVTAKGYKDFSIRIFNRWGEVLYESTDIKEGWDGIYKGKDCQSDVYVYVVNVTSPDDKPYEFSGTVTLLR